VARLSHRASSRSRVRDRRGRSSSTELLVRRPSGPAPQGSARAGRVLESRSSWRTPSRQPTGGGDAGPKPEHLPHVEQRASPRRSPRRPASAGPRVPAARQLTVPGTWMGTPGHVSRSRCSRRMWTRGRLFSSVRPVESLAGRRPSRATRSGDDGGPPGQSGPLALTPVPSSRPRAHRPSLSGKAREAPRRATSLSGRSGSRWERPRRGRACRPAVHQHRPDPELLQRRRVEIINALAPPVSGWRRGPRSFKDEEDLRSVKLGVGAVEACGRPETDRITAQLIDAVNGYLSGRALRPRADRRVRRAGRDRDRDRALR
jgi:hypothetical protein